MVDLKVTTTGMEVFTQLRKMGPEGAEAIARSINRTTQKGKSIITADVAKTYNIAEEKVKKTLRKDTAATAQRLEGSIISTSRTIPLFEFAGLPREPYSGGPRPKGASVNVMGARKWVHQYPAHPAQFAFIARMASGHVGIFARTGEFGRRPKPKIKQTGNVTTVRLSESKKLEKIGGLYSLSVPKMIEAEKVYSRIYLGLQELLNIETDKELKKTIKKLGITLT
ncbi:MAG: hypothetical protein WCQ99_17100 [Pseudomonadota bacterium]